MSILFGKNFYFRCLSLRQTDFCKWLALTELESHIEMREGSELGDRGERVAEWIVTNLGATIEGGAEASTIKQVLCIKQLAMPITYSLVSNKRNVTFINFSKFGPLFCPY